MMGGQNEIGGNRVCAYKYIKIKCAILINTYFSNLPERHGSF